LINGEGERVLYSAHFPAAVVTAAPARPGSLVRRLIRRRPNQCKRHEQRKGRQDRAREAARSQISDPFWRQVRTPSPTTRCSISDPFWRHAIDELVAELVPEQHFFMEAHTHTHIYIYIYMQAVNRAPLSCSSSCVVCKHGSGMI
jgi:type II secretory ATPase GspE/PulE/Tfp pilus assembly ATPase PilB-like protein